MTPPKQPTFHKRKFWGPLGPNNSTIFQNNWGGFPCLNFVFAPFSKNCPRFDFRFKIFFRRKKKKAFFNWVFQKAFGFFFFYKYPSTGYLKLTNLATFLGRGLIFPLYFFEKKKFLKFEKGVFFFSGRPELKKKNFPE